MASRTENTVGARYRKEEVDETHVCRVGPATYAVCSWSFQCTPFASNVSRFVTELLRTYWRHARHRPIVMSPPETGDVPRAVLSRDGFLPL